ncbi:hypothetical protein [Mongoliibacter sp.]|uniref:hypothetical protein n=1 Tax=Mongoliibacter sp. TaxID=2022438 RepID=UPI0025FC5070|nr:hypothetical protein [Mongoliibacter sp.]
MKIIKTTLSLSSMLVLVLLLTACDGNDNGSDPTSNADDFQLEVSGDFQTTASGFADFDGMSSFGVNTWEISMNDNNPQSLSLQLMLTSSSSDVSRPSPGTYEIGFEPNSAAVFTAIYTHIPEGDFMASEEYSTLSEGYGGTLTITSSSENRVEGSFNFSVAKTDDNFNVTGEIEVIGEFTASKRMN